MAHKSLSSKDMADPDSNFDTAYEAHARSIYKFLFWRTQDSDLSEDLTSSVFEKAWKSRKSFHGGSMQAWLYRIARNTLIDYWRKPHDLDLNEDKEILDEMHASVEEYMDRALDAERLERAVQKLPKDMHTVITLRFIEGLSSRAVAQRTGLSESNVRVLQYRALRKLRGYLS